MAEPVLRVCYFGTYRAEYSRNRIMIAGLRQNGVEVHECHEQLWHGIEDRVQAVGSGWKRPKFWWRVLRAYMRLIIRWWQLGNHYDVMVVGYPGQFDVYLARLLSWLHRKPLVWDIFMSIYLIASERGLDGSSPLTVQAIRFIERIATALPDRLVIDTQDYAAWFEQIHNVSASRFRLVPTGADNRYFSPQKSSADPGRKFTVLYYGTFIPNHGVSTIVEAAHQLASSTDITFELVGDGPERALAEHKVRTYGLTNVRFVDWLAPPALLEYIAQADLCLGVFGATPQSLMTVQNKIYEALAMAKPILTGDGPAIRRTLSHGEHAYFCQREDPTALAAAIQTLKSSPVLRARLAEQGYRFFLAHFTVEQLGKRFASALCEVVHLP